MNMCAVKLIDQTHRGLHCKDTEPKFFKQIFPEKKLRGLVSNTYIHYLWAIYTFPKSFRLFGCSKIGGLIVGIYKSLTDT